MRPTRRGGPCLPEAKGAVANVQDRLERKRILNRMSRKRYRDSRRGNKQRSANQPSSSTHAQDLSSTTAKTQLATNTHTVEGLKTTLTEERFNNLQDIVRRASQKQVPRHIARRVRPKFQDIDQDVLVSYIRDIISNTDLRLVEGDEGDPLNTADATSTSTNSTPSAIPRDLSSLAQQAPALAPRSLLLSKFLVEHKSAPTAMRLLEAHPRMSIDMLRILKEELDREPSSRTDMNVLAGGLHSSRVASMASVFEQQLGTDGQRQLLHNYANLEKLIQDLPENAGK